MRLEQSEARRFGAFCRARRYERTTIELEEAGFAGPGDLFLFGCILDDLFAAHLTLNSFHELSVSSLPSQTEYTWTPRSGSQPLV
jgi:type VI secretion system protein ImpG